jgi:hypothetical protein
MIIDRERNTLPRPPGLRMLEALLLALPYLAGADHVTLYTVASRNEIATDLSAMPGPVFDLRGLSDFFNLGSSGCRKDPPKGDDVVASFTVEVDGHVAQTQSCPGAQGTTGNRYHLIPSDECYTLDQYPEGCAFQVDALGVFLNVSSLQDVCSWSSCLVGPLEQAFAAGQRLNVCQDVRGIGFNESGCELCTKESVQADEGPWYGDTGSGWTCNNADPPPSSGRWLPTASMCKCASK